MNKYLATLIFYACAVTIIFILYKLSPDAHDGGPGFGSLAVMALAIVLIGLIIFNVYRGIKMDAGYFVIAAIHAVVLIVGGYRFFI